MQGNKAVIYSEKEELKKKIESLATHLCTSDFNTCAIGHCGHYGKCHIDDYKPEMFAKTKKIKLKSILKNLKSRLNKREGRTNPDFLGNGVHEIASTLVGCDIYEHNLVKGNKRVTKMIANATTLGQMVEILNRAYIVKHGRSRFTIDNKLKNKKNDTTSSNP